MSNNNKYKLEWLSLVGSSDYDLSAYLHKLQNCKCNVINRPLGGDNNKIIPFLFLNLHYAQLFLEQLQAQTKRRGKINIEVMIVDLFL